MMTSTLDNAIADRAHAAGALAFSRSRFIRPISMRCSSAITPAHGPRLTIIF